jgi:hypothetical protein
MSQVIEARQQIRTEARRINPALSPNQLSMVVSYVTDKFQTKRWPGAINIHQKIVPSDYES